jgi:hypothetical protein
MESWQEKLDPGRWSSAQEETDNDAEVAIHEAYELSDRLPWDDLNVKYGRTFLEKEPNRSLTQLTSMAEAK